MRSPWRTDASSRAISLITPADGSLDVLGDLLDLHLSDDLARRHGLAVADEPGADDALGGRVVLRHRREANLDRAHAPTRRRACARILSAVGSTKYSSGRAYGMGVSGTASLTTGALSMPGSVSATVAAISPVIPKDL